MADNGYASLLWADVWEEGETEAKIDGNCTFFPTWQKGDLLWKNHDLCQRQEGYQVGQGMEVWANNDKCLKAHPTPIHSSQVEGSIRYDQWWWSSAALVFLFSPFHHCSSASQYLQHKTLLQSSMLPLYLPVSCQQILAPHPLPPASFVVVSFMCSVYIETRAAAHDGFKWSIAFGNTEQGSHL